MGAALDRGGLGAAPDDAMPAYRPLAEINVTPFVDVMLVLLVVFMIAAPLMTVGVPVHLPRAQALRKTQPRPPVIVSIDRDGRVFLGETELPADGVAERLAAQARAEPDAVAQLRGDRSLPYGRVMEVLGMVAAAGFASVSLQAEAAQAPADARAAP